MTATSHAISKQPQPTYLKDYTPPSFEVESIYLRFDLGEDETVVISKMKLKRSGTHDNALVLDGGAGVALDKVYLDGRLLDGASFERSTDKLTVFEVPDSFDLNIHCHIKPHENISLEGLYKSGGNFCTQCEAEGFRHITFYLDRPDVMARFSTEIIADKALYPVLLSNGNLLESEDIKGGRHRALWDDPFKKPAYLFALVAGTLDCLEDSFTTVSGREVALKIYARGDDVSKCSHAMESLKRAMKWDEEVFGLEYDLDIYNIVAVSDFNMGAMENKSLNIFNTKCVLASAETATDADFDGIEGVIAHEYFHNWTGNRVTCRDWFQLSLKEGLTVFRDQEYSSDIGSRALKRIEDVRVLRAYQYPEDAGPMAHPIRPDSFIEINNFYTSTVYNKGAEVIRMMHALLGAENFRKGMDLYFERHDGEAVTCDDFASAMEDASKIDLSQFRLWYSQAGTPVLKVTGAYDPKQQTYSLSIDQHVPDTPRQTGKKPMHIPLNMGLLAASGGTLAAQLKSGGVARGDGFVLDVKDQSQTFIFEGVLEEPVPSLLRGFSAPVTLEVDYGQSQLALLMAHDDDSFARWEAGQRLSGDVILGMVSKRAAGNEMKTDQALIRAYDAVISDHGLERALAAETLTLPSEIYLGQSMDQLDVEGLHEARDYVRETLAKTLYNAWLDLYKRCSSNAPYSLEAGEKARRRLKNTALSYLVRAGTDEAYLLAREQFASADNMTEVMGAFTTINSSDAPDREGVLKAFYDKWQHEALVIDKWFSVQALSERADALDDILALARHDAFTTTNPNRLRSLVSVFAMLNQVRFHDISGRGYDFLADMVIEVGTFNPQTAARMLAPLSRWQSLDMTRQALMKTALERILSAKDISNDVYEIVSKSLE